MPGHKDGFNHEGLEGHDVLAFVLFVTFVVDPVFVPSQVVLPAARQPRRLMIVRSAAGCKGLLA
jgi:hypothetical protein